MLSIDKRTSSFEKLEHDMWIGKQQFDSKEQEEETSM